MASQYKAFAMTAPDPPAPLEDRVAAVLRSLNQPRTPLADAFFGVTNVDALQNALRGTIQRRSGYAIDRQKDEDLLVIMRRVFAERANSGAADVAAEVARLNGLVLGVAVPMAAASIAAYLAYVRDASRMPDPLPRGTNASIKGTRSLELFRGI